MGRSLDRLGRHGQRPKLNHQRDGTFDNARFPRASPFPPRLLVRRVEQLYIRHQDLSKPGHRRQRECNRTDAAPTKPHPLRNPLGRTGLHTAHCRSCATAELRCRAIPAGFARLGPGRDSVPVRPQSSNPCFEIPPAIPFASVWVKRQLLLTTFCGNSVPAEWERSTSRAPDFGGNQRDTFR